MNKNVFHIFQKLNASKDAFIHKPNLNEIIIKLPLKDFKIKLFTPLFDIDSESPAKIKILALSKNRFKVEIKTREFKLITLVPNLILEVFNPKGYRIIRIIAPPERL
ncbi:hypothetical protein [Chengkuizengella marina]|uniref:Uncharacterized protein n=1 Tax=Chengkuizengella marina TaxID=2507566 RepID=A0A6N9PXY2_9BACL|nr:hypothetical protein [Chengkuizengella marina]NBI27465.1 hypothetical protein [Chengkuizengella marina]